jgi:AraC-like DNA-binding protein
MPLFMDFHQIDHITIEGVKEAHTADVAIQDQYGVKYHQFWVNEEAGTVFCLTEGPDKETVELVHKLAHGNMACALTEVEPGFYRALMGEKQNIEYYGLVKNENGTVDLGYRNIVVVSVRPAIPNNANQLQPFQTPEWAERTVLRMITQYNGRQVNWPEDDSMIGVFNEATDALKCTAEIHRKLLTGDHPSKVIVKIGVGADQPVTKEGNFFTKAIDFAHRLGNTSNDNQITISALVKKLSKDIISPSSVVRYLDSKDEEFISEFHDIADVNLGNDNFTIESMCKDLGMSRAKLYRKMLALTGRAPNDFLRDLRMEKALVLLKYKGGNISEVALEVGYNNPSYFTKTFTEKFGYNPSAISIARHKHAARHLPV